MLRGNMWTLHADTLLQAWSHAANLQLHLV